MIRTCRRGHEQTPANVYQRADGKRCAVCLKAAWRRANAKVVKYRLVEPEAEVVRAVDLPVRETQFTHGYWLAIVRRVALMDPGDGVRIPTAGITWTMGPYPRIMHIAKCEGVRVRVAIKDGWLWVVRG